MLIDKENDIFFFQVHAAKIWQFDNYGIAMSLKPSLGNKTSKMKFKMRMPCEFKMILKCMYASQKEKKT